MVQDEGSSSSVTSSPLHNFSTMPLHASPGGAPAPTPPWLVRELRSDERGLCLIHLLLNRAPPLPRPLPVPPPRGRRRQPVRAGGHGVGEDGARRRPRRRRRRAVGRAAAPAGRAARGPAAPPPHRRARAPGRADADGRGADQGGGAAGRAVPVQPRGVPAGGAGRGVPPREDRRGAGRHLQPAAALPPGIRRRLRQAPPGQRGPQEAAEPGVRGVPVHVARGRVPGRAVGPVAQGGGGDGAGGVAQRGAADGAVRGGAQLLRGAVRLPGVGGAPRVGGARARRALAPRGGGEEHRGLRRRGPAGAARAPGPLGGADGGRRLRPRPAQLLRAAAGPAGGAGAGLRRVQGAGGEGRLLPLLAGARHLLRLRLARPSLRLMEERVDAFPYLCGGGDGPPVVALRVRWPSRTLGLLLVVLCVQFTPYLVRFQSGLFIVYPCRSPIWMDGISCLFGSVSPFRSVNVTTRAA
uniref:Uncharacterized protein n=1 Tax=Zea mays TaxID=4577 RepID=C0PP08_MAIZE|nr:unknown [Zea mays]